MNPILKNVLAVLAGLIGGGLVNMGLVTLGHTLVPVPEGVDLSTMESMKATMHLFETKHYIFPFLAHALGTLVGAYLAARIAATRKMTLAMVIAVVTMVGGVIAVTQLAAPAWFNALDLIVAYLPMGWLGGKLAIGKK
ncbi:MAG: hypothetical protein KDC43_13675 [Saprospiraceae bacterium]|nr:hypothetical protein [Saprospiraceae bacterium]MCB0624924.1 hypothetical protein [Saprospiraceae bacterium]MCB0677896.1 hypothetical protein [Saprospiraceae bacterium]MCB0680516.1 hypothetical protein [Saprospiraceae bacterium]